MQVKLTDINLIDKQERGFQKRPVHLVMVRAQFKIIGNQSIDSLFIFFFFSYNDRLRLNYYI